MCYRIGSHQIASQLTDSPYIHKQNVRIILHNTYAYNSISIYINEAIFGKRLHVFPCLLYVYIITDYMFSTVVFVVVRLAFSKFYVVSFHATNRRCSNNFFPAMPDPYPHPAPISFTRSLTPSSLQTKSFLFAFSSPTLLLHNYWLLLSSLRPRSPRRTEIFTLFHPPTHPTASPPAQYSTLIHSHIYLYTHAVHQHTHRIIQPVSASANYTVPQPAQHNIEKYSHIFINMDIT